MIHLSKSSIGKLELQAVLDVLDSDSYLPGSSTEAFEERFATRCGTRYAVATSSGTSALLVALLAHGIGRGDEVITTVFTSIATVNAIMNAGATPVFVDIESDTYNIDPDLINNAITSRTKAILPVHLFGHTCEMATVQSLAEKYGLIIFEDACQAMGASYRGKQAGSFGSGAFSLSTAAIITSLEGGVITTDDEEVAKRCRIICNHGINADGEQVMLGNQYRMSDLLAAIALGQLDRLDDIIQCRRDNAAYLTANIGSVITPKEKEGHKHVWNKYTVRLYNGQDRNRAVKELNDSGIETEISYPHPVHKYSHVRDVITPGHYEVAERLAENVISLPVHPYLTQAELERIATEVNILS